MRPLRSRLLDPAAAFTLVEMLLGMAIFAVTAAGLYSVLGGSLRLEKKVRDLHARCQDIRLTFDLLDKDLENMIPYPFEKGRSDRWTFKGRRDQMSFFIPADEGVEQIEYSAGDVDAGGRREDRLYRVKNGREIFEEDKADRGDKGRSYFMRRSLPLAVILSGVNGKGVPVALVGGLVPEGVRFCYGVLSKDKFGERKVAFQDEWKDDHIPDVIRIEIFLDDRKASGERVTVRRDFFPVVKGPLT